MDLRLDFAHRNKPVGKQPKVLDHAMIGIALAVDAGKTKVDEVYDFLMECLGLEEYIDSQDSYYQDTSGLLGAVRRQLSTAGYILVSKGTNGTVQVTPEGRAKLQGMNGKALSAGVKTVSAEPSAISVVIETKPSPEVRKLQEACTEYEQLLQVSAEEEAVHEAAIQGMEIQILSVRSRLQQVQREWDVLVQRKQTVEAKMAQSKREQDDLRREMERERARLVELQPEMAVF